MNTASASMSPTSTAARGWLEAPCGSDRTQRLLRWRLVACLIGVAFIATGCSVVNKGTTATKSMIDSLAGKADAADKTNAVAALQGELMREADLFVGTVAQATDELRQQVGTTEARDMGQQWKLNEANVAYVNATDENPLLGAVGMVVLATLSSMVVEDYWVGEKFGAAARPMLAAHRQLETNAWRVVEKVLTSEQKTELRELLRQAREQYPHMRYISAVRLPDLVAKLGKAAAPNEAQKPGSLFGLLYLSTYSTRSSGTTRIRQHVQRLSGTQGKYRLCYFIERVDDSERAID